MGARQTLEAVLFILAGVLVCLVLAVTSALEAADQAQQLDAARGWWVVVDDYASPRLFARYRYENHQTVPVILQDWVENPREAHRYANMVSAMDDAQDIGGRPVPLKEVIR